MFDTEPQLSPLTVPVTAITPVICQSFHPLPPWQQSKDSLFGWIIQMGARWAAAQSGYNPAKNRHLCCDIRPVTCNLSTGDGRKHVTMILLGCQEELERTAQTRLSPFSPVRTFKSVVWQLRARSKFQKPASRWRVLYLNDAAPAGCRLRRLQEDGVLVLAAPGKDDTASPPPGRSRRDAVCRSVAAQRIPTSITVGHVDEKEKARFGRNEELIKSSDLTRIKFVLAARGCHRKGASGC
ncbi:hypothetical protein Q8A73_009594 [Channa argus]|nr:hypothetical protein Q8A73_009594 [Channa argus]